ncbi:MAG: LapA family protein [Pseudomonadota bacterium]|nr:LapA family protein [Pseudomonadota bacterium]
MIGIIVFIPCSIFMGVFAVENRQVLALEFWPISGRVELSASVWVLMFLAVGVLAGLGIGWISTMTWWRRARIAESQIRKLERKLDELGRLPPAEPEAKPSSGATLSAPGSQTGPSRVALIED